MLALKDRSRVRWVHSIVEFTWKIDNNCDLEPHNLLFSIEYCQMIDEEWHVDRQQLQLRQSTIIIDEIEINNYCKYITEKCFFKCLQALHELGELKWNKNNRKMLFPFLLHLINSQEVKLLQEMKWKNVNKKLSSHRFDQFSVHLIV